MAKTFIPITGRQMLFEVSATIRGFTPDMLVGWMANFFATRKSTLDKCGRYMMRVIKWRFDNEMGYGGRWAELSRSTIEWRESHGYPFGPRFKKLRNTMALFKTATRLNSSRRVYTGISSGGSRVRSKWEYEPNSRNPQDLALTLEGEHIGMLQAGGITPTGGVVPPRPFWFADEQDERQMRRYVEMDILRGLSRLAISKGRVREERMVERIARLSEQIRRREARLPKLGR